MSNNLLLLAAAGIGGYFLLKHFGEAGKQETADKLTTALQDYEGASSGLVASREPEIASDGSLIYSSLDPTPANPIPQFTAIVRKVSLSPYDLSKENGTKFISPLLKSSDVGKSYKDPNVKIQLAKVYFFNRDTGKEVAAYELAKSPDWAPWLKDALEDLFAHAFQDACLTNNRYNPWDNRFESSGYPCVTRYPVTL